MKTLRKIIYSMIVIFLLIMSFFVMPIIIDMSGISFEWRRSFFLIVAFLGLVFLILGGVLIWKARKEKGRLKLWMMITGFSAISPLVFSVLHNVFYGFGIAFEKLAFIFEPLHAISFIISIIIAPIGFIIGMIGIFRNIRKKK